MKQADMVSMRAKMEALRRRKGKNKVKKVMGEFKEGSLKSSSGSDVTDKKQAVAIASSEARRGK